MFKAAIYTVILISITACAGNLAYIEPSTGSKISNQIIINKPYNTAWNMAIQKLRDDGFTIIKASKGNIVAESNIKSDDYLDCGYIHSSVATPRAKITRNYDFPAASSNHSYEQILNGNIYDATRVLDLKTRVDFKFTALSRNKTGAEFNVHYYLTRTIHISNASQKIYQDIIDEIDFTSGSTGVFPGPKRTTKCISNGNFENHIKNYLSALK